MFSGTLVVKGHGLALVKATGAGTELGRIGTALKTIEPERTPLQREIDRLVRLIAVLGLGAAALVVVVYGLTRGHWLDGVLAGIATAMAMLPEEFPVVLAVFLALGAWRMSQQHVLTRRPPGDRDARVGNRGVCRQDRHIDDEPHDRARAHHRRPDSRT